MIRRQRLQQARLAEARVLYLHARCNAGLAGLRSRLRRHRAAWLLAGGFGAGVATAMLPGRRLLALAGATARIIGILRVPLGALVAGSRLRPEHARPHAAANPGEA
jgi:hypothetical protein